ncbi:hypothetical protein KIN20_016937 [Parelaphostrongylus tenuis]|uniref:Uncharacterized protein n=1 Tax=Parelaphostrongylus tenuis TaxID=148309 RepID=A0AAD5QQ99_PARTN|nr:hypothetical protein KIN20_016937 [Parelaphostrongylus tenuis]
MVRQAISNPLYSSGPSKAVVHCCIVEHCPLDNNDSLIISDVRLTLKRAVERAGLIHVSESGMNGSPISVKRKETKCLRQKIKITSTAKRQNHESSKNCKETDENTKKFLSAKYKQQTERELQWSCDLEEGAKKIATDCLLELPDDMKNRGYIAWKDSPVKLADRAAPPYLRISWWKANQNRVMKRVELKIGCSLNKCPKSDEKVTVILVCLYDSEKKDNYSEHSRSSNGTDEETKDYILQQHNQTEHSALLDDVDLMQVFTFTHRFSKWNCELEKKAEQAGRNCPKTLTNGAEDHAIERYGNQICDFMDVRVESNIELHA